MEFLDILSRDAYLYMERLEEAASAYQSITGQRWDFLAHSYEENDTLFERVASSFGGGCSLGFSIPHSMR